MEIFRLFGSIFIEDQEAMQSLQRTDSSAQSLGTRLGELGEKATKLGKDLSFKVTAPLVGFGTAAAVTVAKFDDSMSKVSAISGATGKDLDSLRSLAKELGSTTAHSASAAADAMGYLALAGWDTNQILSATPGMLSLASAASMDLAQAADIVSDTMSAFQMDATQANKAADIFAKTSASSNTDVQMLGEAMKYAGAAANAAGMDLAQTSAVMGVLADSGIKGSMAGTTFTAMLRDMKKNADDGKIAVGEMNIALYNADGTMRDLGTIMKDVEVATKDMTTEQKDMALSAIFGEQALKGVNIMLATGSERYEELENAIYNSTGAAEKMASTMEDNLGGSMRALKSATEGLFISFGETLAPTIRRVAEIAADLALKFSGLDENTKKIIVVVGGVVAAIGPLLIIFGTLASSVSKLIALKATLAAGTAAAGAAATTAGTAVTGFSGVLTALTGPIGIVIVAIGAFVAALIYLYNNNEDVRAKIQAIWQQIKDFINTTIELIKVIISTFVDIAMALWDKYGKTIMTITETVFNGIATVIETILGVISGIFETFIGIFTGDWERAWQGVKSTVLSVWDGIVSGIKGSINAILKAMNSMIQAMNKINFSIPEWVPVIGGLSWGFNLPEIPLLAKGGNIIEKGHAIVGEAGPELLELPRGARVTPLDGSHSVGGYQTANIIIELDGRSIVRAIKQPLVNEIRLATGLRI